MNELIKRESNKKILHKRVMMYQGYQYIQDRLSPIALCDARTEENLKLHWKNVTCKKCLKGRK